MSTRRYASTLDPVPADVAERATSSSAVSRRFVALSTKRLQAFLSRPLGELDLRVVCIDGKVFRDHCMVIALGIDTQGRKHVLGLLTVQRLGLTGALQRTLRTTNIIENLNGSVEHYSRNVKRWRGGQMIQRWVASALVEAEKHFRRVRGYRDLQHLVGALDALAPPDGMVADVA